MADIVNGLLLRDQHVLLAHRSTARRTYPNTWSFPGGHVEAGETIEQALSRELSEEIGILARSSSFLHRFDDQPAGPESRVTFHLFAVDEWEGEPVNLGDEHSELRWVSLAAASRMPRLAFASYADLFCALATPEPGPRRPDFTPKSAG